MKRFIKFPSILRFEPFIKEMKQFNDVLPTAMVQISEKHHGSNIGINYSNPDGLWCQSNKQVLSILVDNYASHHYMVTHREEIKTMILKLAEYHDINLDENIITIYGEMLGEKFGKSSCTGLPKLVIMFAHFKVSPLNPDTDVSAYWLPTTIDEDHPMADDSIRFYNVLNFPMHEMELNFNEHENIQEMFAKMINDIEISSPTGEVLGIDGNTGEGFVASFWHQGRLKRFKVKGNKHAKSSKAPRQRTIKEDTLMHEYEKIALSVLPEWRLEQFYPEANQMQDGTIKEELKNIPVYIKMIVQDAVKEELELLQNCEYEFKYIKKAMSTIARQYFMDSFNKL